MACVDSHFLPPRNTANPTSTPTTTAHTQNRVRDDLLDGVASPQTNPLGDGTVLLLSFGKLLLGTETLLALFDFINISDRRSKKIKNSKTSSRGNKKGKRNSRYH